MVKLYWISQSEIPMAAFNTLKENIIWLMGQYGITSEEWMANKEIINNISNDLDKGLESIRVNVSKLKNTTPALIDKKGDEYNGVFFKFTKIGYDTYNELKKIVDDLEEIETNSDDNTTKTFRVWAKIYYPDLIDNFYDSIDNGVSNINIKFEDITTYRREWELELIKTPDTIINEIRREIYSILEPHFMDDYQEMLDKLEIHIVGIPDFYITQVEDIDTSHIGQFIAIEGRVSEQSKIEAKAKEVVFECMRCENKITMTQPFTGAFNAPVYCQDQTCGKKGPFKIIENETKWMNGQTIVLSSMRQSNRIKTIRCFLEGDICKSADKRDGKKVIVTGTLLNIQKLDQTRNKTVSFEFGIKVNNVYTVQDSLTDFPNEDECDMFDQWVEAKHESGLSKIHDIIISSTAPSVFGMEFEKNVTLLPLFSDWTWDLKNPDTERSSLHVLLLGDSGTAKSKIAKDVLNISPRGFNGDTFKSAIQSTAVGLTSVVDKSDIDGKWTLRAGFLASADKGVVVIDEIDKMNPNDLGVIAPVLEDQKQDIAKAASGSFYSRCAVIMTANPDGGKINKYEPIIDQFTIATFLSQRIDIIIGVPDISTEEWDYNVGNRILNNHQRTLELCNVLKSKTNDVYSTEREINIDLLRKYILYSRSKPVPIMTDDAMKSLVNMYVSKRTNTSAGVAPRMLSSLIRVSIAIARRELSQTVENFHAHEAIKLIDAAIKSITGGDNGGVLDYAVLEYGSSHSQRDKTKIIKDIIKSTPDYNDIVVKAEIIGIPKTDVSLILNKLKQSGQVMSMDENSYKLVH